MGQNWKYLLIHLSEDGFFLHNRDLYPDLLIAMQEAERTDGEQDISSFSYR